MASSVRRSGLMTVGELSRRTRVPIKNLRQHTDWGLIYTAGRSESNLPTLRLNRSVVRSLRDRGALPRFDRRSLGPAGND